ncbi:F-box/kelch-repeat protein At1g51550-like [Malus sylvestris]|uniref:F-box/kelch-repeat protein At1g51550-like n=1 Tax=Malus sylvestris TaxID=3752 RepID=UPI0021AC4677|nr:F-box/kelch-repeat protein At1g51550-like [Malus sylvestris]
MAETSTSSRSSSFGYSSSGSPISNLAQDHLFTILLRLPADSILCFAMTCKKFRALAASDSLWESICWRDWGPKSVEALKASNFGLQQLPWMRLYKQVSRVDSVYCRKLSDPDGGLGFPCPRASHSLNFVSGCLVLFGGGCEGGRHLDDTWVAYIGNDFRRMLKWQKINSGIPSGRFGHSCVVIDDFLVMFGGINDNGGRHNDTWVGQVACHESLGVTLSWKLLVVGSDAPSQRGAHAACCIDGRKMVIHGGIGLHGVRLCDTWVLELSENFRFGTWYEIGTHPCPPARSGHTLTCIGGTRTVLFGGRGLGYDVLNDVWFLDICEDNPKWVQVLYELQNVPGGVSLPRVGHSATLMLGGHLLICGGEDSYRHRKNDFWILDINAAPSITMQQPTTLNSMQVSAKRWKRLKENGYKPKCRSFHRACTDNSGQYLFVFGGMMDGLLQPSDPAGLRFDSELLLVELVLR